MAQRSAARLANNVIDASLDLGQCDSHNVGSIDQPVDVDSSAPLLANNFDIAQRRVNESPAQLGDVLHTTTRAQLLPIDQTHAFLVDNDIAWLQVVVDKALMIGRQLIRYVMEMTNHSGQLVEQCWPTPPIIERPTGQPGQQLLILLDTDEPRTPVRTGIGKTTKGHLDQSRVRPRRPPNSAKVLPLHQAERTSPEPPGCGTCRALDNSGDLRLFVTDRDGQTVVVGSSPCGRGRPDRRQSCPQAGRSAVVEDWWGDARPGLGSSSSCS